MVQWVMWTMASLGAVMVGLATVPSSMDFVPVHIAAFIFSVGCGLYAVVRIGLWGMLESLLCLERVINLLCDLRHSEVWYSENVAVRGLEVGSGRRTGYFTLAWSFAQYGLVVEVCLS